MRKVVFNYIYKQLKTIKIVILLKLRRLMFLLILDLFRIYHRANSML